MTNYIQGIDACSIQLAFGPIDWVKVYEAGTRFVYWKASQYSSTVDRTFDKQGELAQAAGLVCGAYHFCAQNIDGQPDTPEEQMEFFYRASNGLGKDAGELPPMLDWEYCTHPDNARCVSWLLRAAVRAKDLWYPNSDRMPVIYTYPYFASQHKAELIKRPELGLYPLCFASYKAEWDAQNKKSILLPWDPEETGEKFLHPLPPPWKEESAPLHQYSGNNGRRVPGIIPDVDRQVFYGSTGEFAEFIGLKRPPHLQEMKVIE